MPVRFCERDERPFFSIYGSLLYPSFHLFQTIFHALMQGDHHSLFYLFAFFHLYFIPPFHSTSSYLILFSSCLMFDMSSASALHACLFDVTIHLSSLFVRGPLGPRLMTFSTHCISCMRGMGIIIIGIFEPSFPSFLSPYYLSLRYVPCLKTTLRPLLHIVFDSSHVGNTRD